MVRSNKSKERKLSRHVRDRHRQRIRELVQHPMAQFVCFGAFVALLVAIMTAGVDLRERGVDREQVGQVAPYDVKAVRDFAFEETDTQSTEIRRDRVGGSVPPVYDWSEGQEEALREQIHRAFDTIRKQMALALTPSAGENLREGDSAGTPDAEQADAFLPRDISILERTPPAKLVDVAHSLRAQHFDPYFPAELREAWFDALARSGFSTRLESAISGVVSEVMTHLIVPNVRDLNEHQESGIYLRRLRDEKTLIEYHLTALDERLMGMEDVPDMVEQAVRRRLGERSDTALGELVGAIVSRVISPNTTYNEALTLEKREAARSGVADVVKREDFRKGQIIVDKGHLITERHVRIFDTMVVEDAYFSRTQVVAGLVIVCLLLLVVFFAYGRRNIPHFEPRTKDIFFLGTALLLFLLMTRLGRAMGFAVVEQSSIVPADAWKYLVPVSAAGMLVRLVLDSQKAVVFSVVFSVLVGLMADHSLFYAVFTLVGCLVGASNVRQVKHRMALMWSGLFVGLVNSGLIIGYLLILGKLFSTESFAFVGLSFAGGLASGFFVSAILPVFEAGFSYTTDIKLLELANLNHPLLRELILRAPGSYHHSMMVGSLCEAASESIGCNALLSRVGAYYHDVGKAKNPQYFAENQRAGENPHDKLKPNMSALIIKAHVKDGLEMARQYRLPVEIQEFIAQHHGTSLIAYFYHKAKQLEDPDIPEVDEKDYRYPGPRPQSRETAICMLADGIEAASRAMPEPSPARLKGLVQTMINNAFTDGQLDECDLTLKDLNRIAKAFTRILTGIYHHRPEYPGQTEKKGSQNERPSEPSDSSRKKRASRKQTVTEKTAKEDSPGTVEVGSSSPHSESRPDPDEGAVATSTSGAKSQRKKTPTQEQRDRIEDKDNSNGKEEHDDAHRDHPSRERRTTPGSTQTGIDPTRESRRSLPRLGSDGP